MFLMARMPALFIGHGSPMNAIEDNKFSRGWKKIAREIPRPKAILCISAHWVTMGTGITAMEKPKTIHDFYGFPQELYDISYSAPGSPGLANRVCGLVKSVKVLKDSEWGLDHGAWSVLRRMYPKADIPVAQLSLNARLSPEAHFKMGLELAPLRDEGVLILGSGNIVHNLRMMQIGAPISPWAEKFDSFVRKSLLEGDLSAIINYSKEESSRLAVPTNEHYLPLLYVAGAGGEGEPHIFNEGYVYSSLSMTCAAYGMKE